MNYFVNEYQNTDEIITECVTAQVHRRSIVLYILIGCLTLCALFIIAGDIYFGVFGLFTGWSFQELMTIILPPLLIWLCIRRKNRAVRIQQERIRVFYKDTTPTYRIEIGEDILAISPESERTLSFSDVMKLIETKNLIILMVRGNLSVTLDKRGFVQGNADECKRYLKGKIN